MEDIFDQMDQSFSGSLLERLGKSANEAKVSKTDQDAYRKKPIENKTAPGTPPETVENTIVNRVKDGVKQPESVVTRIIIEEESRLKLVQPESTDESNMDVEVPVVKEPQPPAPTEAPAEAVSQDGGGSSTDLLHRILASLLRRMNQTDEGILMGRVSCRTARSVRTVSDSFVPVVPFLGSHNFAINHVLTCLCSGLTSTEKGVIWGGARW